MTSTGLRSILRRRRFLPAPTTPPVTDQLTAHYAARLESFADGDSVGTLTDQQNSNDLSQATSSKQPTFRNNATDNIGGHPVVEFDGSDDLLTAPAFYTPDAGEIIVVGRVVTVANVDCLIAASDESSDTEFITTHQFNDDATQEYRIVAKSNTNSFEDEISDGAASTGVVMWNVRSSGSAYNIRIDGTDQTLTADKGSDSGRWFDDPDSLDNFTMGALKRTSEIVHMAFEVGEVLVYSKELTSTERTDIEDWLNDTVGYSVF